MFKKLFEAGMGLGVGLTTGYIIYKQIQEDVKALEKPTLLTKAPCTGLECPVTRWDVNWDRMHDKSNSKDIKMERNIILIRHGQYDVVSRNDAQMQLTDLGVQQAKTVAYRLKQLNLPYTSIRSSRMTRAVQTAKIIQENLPDITLSYTNILNEGVPGHVIPPLPGWDVDDGICYKDSQRCEASFRQLFHRSSKPRGPTFEIVVCHANLIRFFLCRALQFPPEAWLRFSIPNCSLTWITIHGNGTVSARCVGEHTHLPFEAITY